MQISLQPPSLGVRGRDHATARRLGVEGLCSQPRLGGDVLERESGRVDRGADDIGLRVEAGGVPELGVRRPVAGQAQHRAVGGRCGRTPVDVDPGAVEPAVGDHESGVADLAGQRADQRGWRPAWPPGLCGPRGRPSGAGARGATTRRRRPERAGPAGRSTSAPPRRRTGPGPGQHVNRVRRHERGHPRAAEQHRPGAPPVERCRPPPAPDGDGRHHQARPAASRTAAMRSDGARQYSSADGMASRLSGQREAAGRAGVEGDGVQQPRGQRGPHRRASERQQWTAQWPHRPPEACDRAAHRGQGRSQQRGSETWRRGRVREPPRAPAGRRTPAERSPPRARAADGGSSLPRPRTPWPRPAAATPAPWGDRGSRGLRVCTQAGRSLARARTDARRCGWARHWWREAIRPGSVGRRGRVGARPGCGSPAVDKQGARTRARS